MYRVERETPSLYKDRIGGTAEPQLPIVPSEASRARTTLLGVTDLDLSSHHGPSILPLWTSLLPSA